MLTVVPGAADADDARPNGGPALIDELVREGARRMLAQALQAEVEDYIARHLDERDDNGRRLVVRNGSHQPREVLTSAGAVEVTAPRVNDRRTDPDTGERARFSSAIPPPWCRKTPKITELLPLLYLHGLSTGDFVPALGQFLGSTAGLSAPVITKLTETWKTEQRTFAARDPGLGTHLAEVLVVPDPRQGLTASWDELERRRDIGLHSTLVVLFAPTPITDTARSDLVTTVRHFPRTAFAAVLLRHWDTGTTLTITEQHHVRRPVVLGPRSNRIWPGR